MSWSVWLPSFELATAVVASVRCCCVAILTVRLKCPGFPQGTQGARQPRETQLFSASLMLGPRVASAAAAGPETRLERHLKSYPIINSPCFPSHLLLSLTFSSKSCGAWW